MEPPNEMVLVTGAMEYPGSHVIDRLVSEGAPVTKTYVGDVERTAAKERDDLC